VLTAQLHIGHDERNERSFYATVRPLMGGRGLVRPKHVAVDVLYRYCDSNELCALVDSDCGNITGSSRYLSTVVTRVYPKCHLLVHEVNVKNVKVSYNRSRWPKGFRIG
jgi:hypothetical protein